MESVYSGDSLMSRSVAQNEQSTERHASGFQMEKAELKADNPLDFAQKHNRFAAYDSANTREKRRTLINNYYKDLSTQMDTLCQIGQSSSVYEKTIQLANDEVESHLFTNEKERTDIIERYSQGGILFGVRELTYEKTMAEKCKQANDTKSTRKRQEKRQKAWRNHAKAAFAASNSAFKELLYSNRTDLDEDEKAILYKHANTSVSAKKELLDSIKDADSYDTENNIKMARRGKKRAIDLGDGTTKFFQKMAKLRTNQKVLEVQSLILADYVHMSNNVPAREADKLSAKTQKLSVDVEAQKDRHYQDIDSVMRRMPELLHALVPSASIDSLKATAAALEAKDNYGTKMAFIDLVMTDEAIASCIRKDSRTGENFASAETLAEIGRHLISEFNRISGVREAEINLER